MSFLMPWGLAALASIPALIWLWRFAASRQQTVLPSLVPFEHLLRRPPTRRTQLLVNLLFWLQAAALLLASLALAEPALLTARTRTVLVLLDTSASMAASVGGPSPFQRATRALSSRLARKRPGERFFVVGTAPVRAITEAPSSDAMVLRQQVDRAGPSDMAGNLAVARRIGQALLGVPPDEILVLTDEPPPQRRDPAVTFQSFDEPMPNAAVIGVDAHEPLCSTGDAKVVVTIQHAADIPQEVTVTATHQGRILTKRSEPLEPAGRVSVTVPVPEGASGLLDIAIRARRDALAVDNRAAVPLRGSAPIPVVVASEHPDFLDTVGRWLAACPRIAWTPRAPDALTPAPPDAILVTDHAERASSWPGGSMVFARGRARATPVLTQWLIDTPHPVGEYLDQVEAVATAVALSQAQPQWGDPVVWGLADGRRVPLVQAASLPAQRLAGQAGQQGRRTVAILADPTAGSDSVPLLLVFLNGLRWVAGSPERVTIVDPAESNTMTRLSTWGAEPLSSLTPTRQAPRFRHPIAPWLLGVLALVLAVEWGLYLRKMRRI